ncbi:ribonuclease N [Streptomyces cinnabarinus]|uniref:Ribonuclease N n=1 Tax=Streptomyces cinnabarinus TaxID=67287 RepID=A0ABY7K7C3_9ACTN|nr:ribonuclease domain-containing protein [Streptomyces cinnabarinus]WAZ20400.1 ribonuclease N [Streptomyces cinnabarinus]
MLLRAVPRLLLCVLLLLAGCATDDSATASRAGGMATVGVADLPDEARETLRLIDDGGPFPYPRDGSVFGNREGLLPERARGYYREYTVPTPGSPDRGARRIVAGRAGELYYTDDHYRSFRVVGGSS